MLSSVRRQRVSFRPAFETLEDRCVPAWVVALDQGSPQHLIPFLSDSPGIVFPKVAITGLQAGDQLVGINYRPATDGLYGLGGVSQSGHISALRLYTINQTTGAATLLSPAAGVSVGGADVYSFAFDPYADQIRVIGRDGENLRLSPDTGTLLATDTPLPTGTAIVGIAYTPGTTLANRATLFGIDEAGNNLVLLGGSAGTVSPVGSLGDHFLASFSGLSIAPGSSASAGTAFTAENLFKPLFAPSLVTLNLATGATTAVGDIGGAGLTAGFAHISSLAIQPTATFTPPTAPALPAGAAAGQRFVAQTFFDLLGRAPDAGELTALGALIDQGLVGRLPFVLAVEQSPEYLTRVVNADYFTILGRPAEPNGLNVGVLFLASGGSNEALRAILYGSPEYLHEVGGTTNALLGALFRATTGQAIDAGSLGVLSGVLSSGVPPTSLALVLLQTPAAAQQQVTQFFQTYLGRTPSAAELAAHAALVAAGQANLDLALILSSPEFLNDLTALA